MLEISRLQKRFPGVLALDEVDFEVEAGEVHALVGENGAGKSTLVKILGGGHIPDAGEVRLDGIPLPYGDPKRVRESGIGVIYQELTLVPELTTAANIFLGREETQAGFLSERAMVEAARQVLHRLGCDFDPRTPVKDLSVGRCQLVEVARSLAAGSRFFVFDEPSATLTPEELKRLFATILELRAQGFGIIYISHRLEEIFAISDRVTVLRDGQHIRTAQTEGVSRDQLIRWMVGRELREEPAARQNVAGTKRLEVRRLQCRPYFFDVSFEIHAGEILGLAGLVGAGRTSVGLALFGRLAPTDGEILLDGRPVRFPHPRAALDAGVGYLTEDRKGRGIFPELSVDENVTISNLEEYQTLFLRETRRREAARQSCERFDVRAASLDRPIATLSGGNQQKALLARLLSHPLEVAILDEPTRGVDVGARSEVYDIIGTLTEAGVSVLLISSDLPELLAVCDRIAVLREGYSVGVLSREQATQERIIDLATKAVTHP